LGGNVEIVRERDLLKIGDQRVDPHVPAAGQRRLAPAGDEREDAKREHAFEQDGSREGPHIFPE